MRHLAALTLALAVLAPGAADARPVDGRGPSTDGWRIETSRPARGTRLIRGRVSHVRDGDTIEVAGEAVRLWGVHAPELHAPGGPAARRWMLERAAGRFVVCDVSGRRSRDRRVAVCRTGDGDLAAQLIAAGLGRDCPRFSAGWYAGLETEAARALVLPAYCRACDRRPSAGP